MASETESKYPSRPRFEDKEPIVQLGGVEWAKTDITRNHELRELAQLAHAEHLRLQLRSAVAAGICLGIALSAVITLIILVVRQ